MSGQVHNIEAITIGSDRLAVLRADGHGWFALRPACDALGIDPNGQMQRLGRAPWATTCVIHAVGADSRNRDVACLRADKVAMWLATIDTNRLANDEARAKLVTWQLEAAEALDHWVRGGQVQLSQKDQARLADALEHHDIQIRTMQATIEQLAAEQRPTVQQQPAPQLSAPIEMEVGNLKIKVRSVEEASVLLAQLRSDAQLPTPVEASIAPTAQRLSGKKAKAKAQTRRSSSKELSQSRKELAAHLMLYAAQVSGATDWAGRTKAWSLFYDALAEKGYDPRLRRVQGQRPIDVMDAEGRIDWALKIAREAFPIAK